jgi:hypothetical protein
MLDKLFGKSNAKRLARVKTVAGQIRPSLDVMHAGERAAVLMMVGVQMATLKRIYGAGLVNAPSKNPELVKKVLDDLIAVHDSQAKILDTVPSNLSRYFRVHFQANLISLITIATGLDSKTFRPMAVQSWKTLHESRDSAERALNWLRKGEAATGVPCFPEIEPGLTTTDLVALEMVNYLPNHLKPKKKPAPTPKAVD